MSRKLEFEIEGVKALAVMHDDITPKACDTIWKKLPLEGMLMMAKWGCREMGFHLAGEMYFELEHEGPKKLYTAPGDIGYFLRGPELLGSQAEYDPEFKKSLCEIDISYGLLISPADDLGRMIDKDKWEKKPILSKVDFVWAHFLRPMPKDFYLKCESIRHGRKKLTIRKYKK